MRSGMLSFSAGHPGPLAPPSCFSSQCPSGELFASPCLIATALPPRATRLAKRSQAYSSLAVRCQSWVKSQVGSEGGLMML